MSNAELRLALAASGWTDVRADPTGRLVGRPIGWMSFAPELIPDWPQDLEDAIRFGKGLASAGHAETYMVHLLAITGATAESPAGLIRLAHANARERSEAALLTLHGLPVPETAG